MNSAPTAHGVRSSSMGSATGPRANLVVVPEYCTRAAGSDCARCAYCCPHGAIALPEGAGAPTVDNEACNGCGICFGVCDAFASTHLTMHDLHERLRRANLQGRTAYLTCWQLAGADSRPDGNVLVLPCLSMVPPELWTLLLAEDTDVAVACDFSLCEGCALAGELGGALFPRSIEMAQDVTGREVTFAEEIPQRESLIGKYTRDEVGESRREALSGVVRDFTDIANGSFRKQHSTVLADYYARKERMHAQARLAVAANSPFSHFVPEGSMKRTLFPKRKWLLEAVSSDSDIAPNIDLALSVTDARLCDQSHACTAHCPTGARAVDPKTGKLDFEPAYCVGCGICVDACPNGACSIEAETADALRPFLAAMHAKDDRKPPLSDSTNGLS